MEESKSDFISKFLSFFGTDSFDKILSKNLFILLAKIKILNLFFDSV